ncbi:MAG TPA: type II toxin-antitoxin system VapC family toxin [Nocardioidaceae bacterium]|nr:type II toxin-antitoxin system VapC family toxin [Nocardioidaceae bacterium]
MIYLDSSALMKLVRREDETAALADWLSVRHEQPTVTSELGRVEVLRAARRVGGQATVEARAVIGDLDLVPLDRAVQDLACDIADPPLRTLDALHLASAILLSEALTTFVAYDDRLVAAAEAAGLAVAAPGRHSPAPGEMPRSNFDRESSGGLADPEPG